MDLSEYMTIFQKASLFDSLNIIFGAESPDRYLLLIAPSLIFHRKADRHRLSLINHKRLKTKKA